MTDWKSEYEAEHEKRLADKVRIAKLEAKLQLTEGAFKNTRIRELEALLFRALHTGQLDTVRNPAPPHLADEIRQACLHDEED